MAHIASMFLSTANSSPSSQVAKSYRPGSVESDFPAMLSQASFSEKGASRANTSGAPASDGVNAPSATNLLSGKIRSLLKNGVSLDRISKVIASKLVALADGKSGSSAKVTAAKVTAVAAYLNQGESGAQDAESTANHLVKKVVALLSELREQNGSTGASSAASNTGSAKIVAPAADPLLSAIMALLPPSWQSAAPSTVPSSNLSSSLVQLAESIAGQKGDLTAPSTVSTAARPSPPSTPPTVATAATVANTNDTTASTAQAGPAPASGGSITPCTAGGTSDTGEIGGRVGPPATGPRVNTALESIISGEGTALERALIRAAGTGVAQEPTLVVAQTDSCLAALSASLNQLFGGATSVSAVHTADQTIGPAVAFALTEGAAQGSAGPSPASAPAGTQSMLHIDDVMDQVVSRLSMRNFHDNPTVSMVLNPPDLGRLSVKISVADSNVTASVVAPSSEVQNALLAHRSQLDQLFASAGLKLGSLNVDVSGQGLGEEAASRQAQRENLLAASAQTMGRVEDKAASDAAKQGSGPSMLGSINLTLLNQLV